MLKSSNLNSVIDQLDADRTVSGAAVVPENNNKLVKTDDNGCSMAALQMSFGVLEIAEPPLVRVRAQLKELIGKQNKFYIDVSKEKYKLDCSEVAKLIDMMNDVKRYKERLVKIKKDMQSIYQRSKVLKKRAANVATCKQRDYQRKLEKQQQEESLIGGQLQ
ncbi:biogenesis of lysosome-related organelles complex 1 subunit 6 [Drosophila novamexicana]|uniref:biogenesis of lysosome-related organelles complex 1 subunit 6 n=1 Tax=Drosophila novamexicana TaxID=47314 RepID=UPI0011E5FF5F|nr:biogenesis of lysosome-related organelles complex 1 subunit 6 [Drosophila novamexicana]